jgi:hypothetical protein
MLQLLLLPRLRRRCRGQALKKRLEARVGISFRCLGLCCIKALRACEATNIVNELGVEANRELLLAQGVAKESAALELSSPTKRLSDSSALSVAGREVSQAWKLDTQKDRHWSLMQAPPSLEGETRARNSD